MSRNMVASEASAASRLRSNSSPLMRISVISVSTSTGIVALRIENVCWPEILTGSTKLSAVHSDWSSVVVKRHVEPRLFGRQNRALETDLGRAGADAGMDLAIDPHGAAVETAAGRRLEGSEVDHPAVTTVHDSRCRGAGSHSPW